MNLIPKPNSSFLRVKCSECENEMIVFDHAKTKIECSSNDCNALIAEPMGGKARLHAEVIDILN